MEFNLINEFLKRMTLEDGERLTELGKYVVIEDGQVVDIWRENERGN